MEKINGKFNFSDEELNKIKYMYNTEHIGCKKIASCFSCAESVIDRALKDMSIEKRHTSARYSFNEHIFDVIDSPEKAYWIAFIWCDGYNGKRIRGNKATYEVKLSLSEQDSEHLAKLKLFLKSNHDIKYYKFNGFNKGQVEARLLLSNTYLGSVLENKYGMVAHRENSNKLMSNIPLEYMKDFIRGVIDAEGSIIMSYTHDKSRPLASYKSAVSISTYKTLLVYIQDFLYENNLITNKSKLYRRHQDRDEFCVQVKYCGNNNVVKLLDWLYDGATIYLDRKYNKYLNIKEILNK